MQNMADERFEIIALIFRLAGVRPEYTELETDYQRKVAEAFTKFAEHPAVKLAKTFDGSNGVWVGYDAVVKFAVHIEKKDNQFVFIDDISSMFDNGRWNEVAAKEFLPLFNDFYNDTNYANFFNSHTELFEQNTQKFINEIYDKVDFEWFRKYVDPSNLRSICSPSISMHNYGATVNDEIIYCVTGGITSSPTVVHEYCHSFSNPLARKWYKEDEVFKKWCDDSVNTELNPSYTNGWTMSGEYVTRAYTILYCCQCDGEVTLKSGKTYKWRELTPIVMANDYRQGFIYIGGVYEMIFKMEREK